MDIDLNNINSVILGYMKSSGLWIVMILGILVIFSLFYGYMNRKSKLKYNCLECVRFGNGKIGINLLKAGYMKEKSFFGIFDYGKNIILRTSDGRRIEKGKTTYLHEIFGKKGFIVVRNPNDNKILVPISRVEFENLKLVLEVAPADFRNASIQIFREAIEETKGTLEKILPFIAIGLCVFLCIITIVICMQMTNNATNNVGETLIKGCSSVVNVKSSPTAVP